MPNKRIIIFPGSFDPMTLGHLDIIHRGRILADELIVAVGENPEKQPMLTRDARVDILRQVTSEMPNVSIQTYDGLTVDFARNVNATAILRGLRNNQDLAFELQLAHTNRLIASLETVFLMADPKYAYTSSSLIRQAVQMGADVSSLVPPKVLPFLRQK